MSSSSRGLRPFAPQRFGRYTLLTHLATGGMGTVYLARLTGAEGFQKLVVIKKILPQYASESSFVERFLDEARIVVQLQHGSIAQVLDMGSEGGEYYIAMEFVDGKDLRKVAARARELQRGVPPALALFVMARVLDALAYAHRKQDESGRDLKVVHRDISLQNVIVSYEGEVKVIDFGLAKSAQSLDRTRPQMLLGKFFYMAPEQARHQPVDRRCDLYAAGICLWELLAGKNPFDEVKPYDILRAVAEPEIPGIRALRPELPEALEQTLARALAPDPAQRIASAEEMRGRLTAVMHELDPGAGPESLAALMRGYFDSEYASERRTLSGIARARDEASDEGNPPPAGQPEAREDASDAGSTLRSAPAEPLPPSERGASPPPVPLRRTTPAPGRAPSPQAPAAPAAHGAPPAGRPAPGAAQAARAAPAAADGAATLIGTPLAEPSVQVSPELLADALDDKTPPSGLPLPPRAATGAQATSALQDGAATPSATPAGAGLDGSPTPLTLRTREVAAEEERPPAPSARARRGRGPLRVVLVSVVSAVAVGVVAFAALRPLPALHRPPAAGGGEASPPSTAAAEVAPAAVAPPEPSPAPALPEPAATAPESLKPVEGARALEAVPTRPREPERRAPSGRDPRRQRAKEQYDAIERTFKLLLAHTPCSALGKACTDKPIIDDQYRRMIDRPEDLGKLEPLLDQYRAILDAKAKAADGAP